MDMSRISIKESHHCRNQKVIEDILSEFPLALEGSKDLRMEAHMGSGNMIYLIRLSGGITKAVPSKGVVAEDNECGEIVGKYQSQVIIIRYN